MTGGWLTTHILDAAHGVPAKGVKIDLIALGDGSPRHITTIVTNDDGRSDAPLLAGDAFVAGVYQLDFHIGDYFRARGTALPEPAFLDVVPIRFGIADQEAHYHVPLLASPFSFSTYRGS